MKNIDEILSRYIASGDLPCAVAGVANADGTLYMGAAGLRSLDETQAMTLLATIKGLIDSNNAKNLVLILDTIKKYTDLMDKKQSSLFTQLAREFVQAGGTLIGTAHANKNDNANGEVIEAGTSDLKDDIDCAYTLKHIGTEGETHTVEFTNTKNRGDVTSRLVFQYTKTPEAGYKTMLDSVKRLDHQDLDPLRDPLRDRLRALQSLKENADAIDVITSIIKNGNGDLFKGDIAEIARKKTGIGINKIRSILDMHEGDNYDEHYRWTQHPNNQGIRYELLDAHSVSYKTCN